MLKKETPFVVAVYILGNESKIIRRGLDSLIPLVDFYVMGCNGKDNTEMEIKSFFADHGITDITDLYANWNPLESEEDPPRILMKPPMGIIYRDKWWGFGLTRVRSLIASRRIFPGTNGFDLMLDADMTLTIKPEFKKEQLLESDGYYSLIQKSFGGFYPNTRLIRRDFDFACEGRTHEYWHCLNKGANRFLFENLVIEDLNDGGSKADKFPRDVRELVLDLLHRFSAKNLSDEAKDDRTRWWYYLFQTLCSWIQKDFFITRKIIRQNDNNINMTNYLIKEMENEIKELEKKGIKPNKPDNYETMSSNEATKALVKSEKSDIDNKVMSLYYRLLEKVDLVVANDAYLTDIKTFMKTLQNSEPDKYPEGGKLFWYLDNKKKLTDLLEKLGEPVFSNKEYRKAQETGDYSIIQKLNLDQIDPELRERYDLAVKIGNIRVKIGGFGGEIYNAYLWLGKIHTYFRNYSASDAAFNYACKLEPFRAEAYFYLGKSYRKRDNFENAYTMLKKGISLPVPGKAMLFTNSKVYNFKLHYQMIITASWVKQWKAGLKSCQQLMALDNIPEYVKNKATNLEKVYLQNYLSVNYEKTENMIEEPPLITDVISLEQAGITEQHLALISKPFVRTTTASKPWITKTNVSCVLASELGSQLFQIAAVLSYATRFEKVPVLARKLNLNLDLEVKALKNSSDICEQDNFKDFTYQAGDILLKGVFGSEKYFKEQRTFVCDTLLKSLGFISNPSDSLGICYFIDEKDKKLKNVEFASYYKPLLDKNKPSGQIQVVTNNLSKAKNSFVSYYSTTDPKNVPIITYHEFSVDSLNLLINCSKGLIISNSHFGWWAAYLKTYLDQKDKKESIIIAPTVWFKDIKMNNWKDRYVVEGWKNFAGAESEEEKVKKFFKK